MLLLVVSLCAVKGHHRHCAQGGGQFVLSLDKGSVIELGSPARERLKGLPLKIGDAAVSPIHGDHSARPMLSDAGQFAASDHHPISVDDTHCAIDTVLHLEHDALEHPA